MVLLNFKGADILQSRKTDLKNELEERFVFLSKMSDCYLGELLESSPPYYWA
jgi:hypothetical protein